MSQQANQPDTPASLESEAAVIEYLKNHPDFFNRHPEALSELEIPHQSGAAVSLIERQVESLRTQMHSYQTRLDELIAVGRDNDQLQQKLHRLTLALIDAVTFEEVLTALEDELHGDFKADAVELRLFSNPHLTDHYGEENPKLSATFDSFFKKNAPVCGTLEEEELAFIFGTEGKDIASTALIPLNSDGVLGLLAIGSRDADRFAPHHGTDFLARLGDVIGRTLQAVSLPGL
ncbi:hypothetical protein QQ73_13195 [Candidatus Endoriftia persephone str. Guaymas]|jgi:uncharacterized protein YigA (DUF484 family)|uniref:Phytochrome sensor protein n=3 Tax=Gammaproteobacteria TaxID=1236 RepID=G2FH64_9GAMM|nr:DUF484 family protein [Candidatus Endoriftia persephone]EGV50304.1 protein of unknown function DUF484 [endosymbiont of Riftia pachyptila (vent Ph05)]EGW53878.1 protein of unknown function DUF484 [endosymbiont of Tevnia jerichonana (vent Tica)]MBA1332031.1 hypothetical protein [Candidatus Endoriftia persephone str. Guaymas]USF87727.1 DUF484 family protein [Candidatus Endoriftia persephone]